MGTFYYSNYLIDNTKTSKVYAIPDSGLFLVDYYSPLAGIKVLRSEAISLLNLVNDGFKYFPIH
jgi:hypothetical protein